MIEATKTKRVLLAMSGGVDSSVSAQLLLEQGYDVIGLFMRTGAIAEEDSCGVTVGENKKSRGCCSAIDAADARTVADRLNIPFYAMDFEDDFKQIKDYFVDEYMLGRTPNPCVVCNNWLKFGKLWEYARNIDADCIATGHYAKIVVEDGVYQLHRSDDSHKDQTYFLFGLQYNMLSKILFPIGDLEKSRVREIADSGNLGIAKKPDSQEICFVPTGKYLDFIRSYKPELEHKQGIVKDHLGNEVGTHPGIENFTIGQRKGLGIAHTEPRYVLDLQPDENLVIIGPSELLYKDSLQVEKTNWLLPESPKEPIECSVKIRYQCTPAKAKVTPLSGKEAKIEFEEPQSSITPGQAAVFYINDRLIGGGWIKDE